MFAGHFGVAAIVKAKQPEVPLWAYMVATQLLDIAFLPLLAAGIEKMDTSNGSGYGDLIIHAEYTHSLVGMIVIAMLAGLAAAKAWGKRGGIAVGAVVISHWLLDLLVHRPDMPFLPGNLGDLPLLGLGLWNYPTASAIVELTLVIAGLILYVLSLRVRRVHTLSKAKSWTFGIATGLFMIMALVSDVFGL